MNWLKRKDNFNKVATNKKETLSSVKKQEISFSEKAELLSKAIWLIYRQFAGLASSIRKSDEHEREQSEF